MAIDAISSRNPYAGFGKVVGGTRLVGRESTIAEITEKLYMDAGSIAVIGNPRIGKTSVVTEALQRLRASSNKHITIEVALSTMTTETELFSELRCNVQKRLQAEGEDPAGTLAAESSEYNAYKFARLCLERANQLGFKTVLVVDEFDSITSFTGGHITIQRLRELMSRNFETGLSAVVIARRSLRAIEAKTRNTSARDISTLDGVCEQIYLRPLDRNGRPPIGRRS